MQRAIKEVINKRLKVRLQIAEEKETIEIQEDLEDQSKITTTQDEIDGFNIVRAIVGEVVDLSRIAHRDTQTYFGILLDDNNRKPICRLFVEGNSWYIGLIDEEKNMTREKLEKISDIYQYGEQLKSIVMHYEGSTSSETGL